MVTTKLTTTAFRLDKSVFGTVYGYRPNTRFERAWNALERSTSRKKLPYASLAVALRILTRDFVVVQRRSRQRKFLFISRQRIRPKDLALALRAWESAVFQSTTLYDAIDYLDVEELCVADSIRCRPGLTPVLKGGNWPWNAAIWDIAHLMSRHLLRTDAADVRLRLDSDGSLLTWDNLVGSGSDGVRAMHRITPKLITVPGVEDFVISFHSSLARLAPLWKFARGPKNAWALVNEDAPILRTGIYHREVGDGQFRTEWQDDVARLIESLSVDKLPSLDVDPDPSGPLRVGFGKQPRYCSVGKGVGQWFHEIVSHHAYRALSGLVDPLELERLPGRWHTATTVGKRVELTKTSQQPIRIVVVYALSETRQRVRDGICDVLLDGVPDADRAQVEKLTEQIKSVEDRRVVGNSWVEVVFLSPVDAREKLLQRSTIWELEAWYREWGNEIHSSDHRVAAIVETDETAADGPANTCDPKHALRRMLAADGVVTQFITANSKPKPTPRESDPADHAPKQSVGDLLRSAGWFLRPFYVGSMPTGTIIVGIYVTRVFKKRRGKKYIGYKSDPPVYLVNMVAIVGGTVKALGYVKEIGWLDLGDATAAYLGSDQDIPRKDAAKALVESAIGQLRVALGDDQPLVLVFDALGCRGLWPSSLNDGGDGKAESWMSDRETSVVRVRSIQTELPKAAGEGELGGGFDRAGCTSFRAMTLANVESSPLFVVSGSAVMDRGQTARKSSRFACHQLAQKSERHSLCSTEIRVLEPGRWDAATVARQIAMLCRISPHWSRTLRWPSPLHLARAVVQDHPYRDFADRDKESEEPS